MTVEFKSEIVNEWFQAGKTMGPGWESIAKMNPLTWATGGPVARPDPQSVPDALCGNCRRDRHEYPLTENLAQMWENVAFDEDYDPDTDVSRIVCPGSDVCGPLPITVSISNSSWTGYETGFIKKMLTWTEPYLPPIKWEISLGSTWNIDKVQELKDNWTYKTLGAIENYIQFDEPLELKTWYPDIKDVGDIFSSVPLEQAALEAAPKAIEMAHKVPEPPGYDFSSMKTDYPPYPTGKKKK